MTTLLNRALLGLLAILMVVGGIEFLDLRSTRSKLVTAQASLSAAQTEVDSLRRTLKSTNAALAVRARAVAQAQASLAVARKDLDHALQENPGWAATAVPDAVWQRLYGPAPAASAAGAPTR